MNKMQAAFERLSAAKRKVTAGGDVVILDGREIKTSLVEEITTDEVMALGGIGEQGGYRVHVAMSECAEMPEKGSDISVNGNTQQVLNVIERNRATYEISCGDLSQS